MPGEQKEEKTPEEIQAEAVLAATKPPEGYTEEEWSGLSDTEKEGIRDSIAHPDGGGEEEELTPEQLAAIAKEGETPEEKTAREAKEAEDAAEAKKATDDAAEASRVAALTPEEKAAEAAKPPAEEPPAFMPDEDLLRFRAVVPDAELKVEDVVPEEIQTKIDELDAKYESGDVDLKAYNRERDALNRAIWNANQAVRDEARTQQAWLKEQGFFFQNRPEYMEKTADGKTFTEQSQEMFDLFKIKVSRFEKDPRYANAPGMELLLAADKAVRKTLGVGKAAPSAPLKEAAPAKPGVKPPAKLPENKTLSEIPAAAGEEITGDPFAALDKLSGEAYEKAIEKLTPAQKEAYEAGASKPSRIARV
jgi:hypothetical protein